MNESKNQTNKYAICFLYKKNIVYQFTFLRENNYIESELMSACLIFVYIWLIWGKPGSLLKPVVHKISAVGGNLFIFGLACYFCPGKEKINILTSQFKRISNEQGVPSF